MAKKPNKQPIPKAAVPAKPQVAPIQESSSAGTQLLTMRNLCILLALVCFGIYFNTLWNGYVLDDVMVLKENTMVLKGFGGIGELMTTPHMRGYLIIPNDMYRPLSLVMFAIEVGIFGLNPMVGHFFNIVWFAGCVIMLFIFLDKFFDGKKIAIAFIAAFVFAVHPIHTEVVANIKSRDELMCFFFAFWSLNLFMNYMKQGKALHLILGIIAFFLSFLSKETVIAFIGIIPVLFFFYANENKKRAVIISAGAVAVTLAFIGIRLVILNEYNANQPAPVEFIDNALSGAPSALSRVATEVVILGKYLWLMFIPYPLLANYSFNAIPYADLSSIKFWVALLAHLGLVYVAVTRFLKNKKDPWSFAILFYLATLFLFSNIPFLMGATMAERFAFFCSMGYCLAAGLGVEQWLLKSEAGDINILKSKKVLVILVPLLLLFGGMTLARNADWRNGYMLFSADVKKSPNDSRLYHYLATVMAESMYEREQDTVKRKAMDAESIENLKKALIIYPDFADAHIELGRVYDREKMHDSALVHDLRAIELNPNNATARNNLGNVYLAKAKWEEAKNNFLIAIQLNPNLKYSYYNAGLSFKQMQKFDSAIIYFNIALAMEPGNMNAHQELGTVFYFAGNLDSAAHHFKIFADANPADANAANNLGAIYMNRKRYAEAIALFTKAITANPQQVNAYSNLGRAYFYSRQYANCIDIFIKEFNLSHNPVNIPYIAKSYEILGKTSEAQQYEALAKKYYPAFKMSDVKLD